MNSPVMLNDALYFLVGSALPPALNCITGNLCSLSGTPLTQTEIRLRPRPRRSAPRLSPKLHLPNCHPTASHPFLPPGLKLHLLASEPVGVLSFTSSTCKYFSGPSASPIHPQGMKPPLSMSY